MNYNKQVKTQEKQKLTKEEKGQVKELDEHLQRLKKYFEDIVIPDLFKQDIRFDVLDMYASEILKTLITIQKGKTKNWEKYLAIKEGMDEEFYALPINQLEYVNKD